MGFFSALFGGGSSLGDLQIRVVEKQLDKVSGYEVQCKGLIPVYTRKTVGFITSIICKDKTGDWSPVLSMLDFSQEDSSTAYQSILDMGEIPGSVGYSDWVGIAMFFPDMLQASYGGNQKLGIVVRLVDMNDMPLVSLGFSPRSDSIWTESVDFEYDFDSKGYKEEQVDKDESRALAIKLGVAVALVDDNFDDREGETLKKWIKKIIAPYSDERKEELKELYENAWEESYKLELSGNLSLNDICNKMNEIADKAQKHEALELVNEIMAADTKILESETKLINHICELLDIDPIDAEKIRDKQLVKLKPTSGNIGIESLLGIDPTWSNSKILGQLGKEFVKWNGRMNSLQEGKEKDNAQRMLDLIGETRKKYV